MKPKNQRETDWKRKTAVFLTGQGISLFGSQLVQMAMIWYVTLETSSGVRVTLLTLAAFLPQMLISPLAGVWADRYRRKTIILVSDAAIAVSTLALALFLMAGHTGGSALTAILIVSAVRSLGSGVQTPAVNAMLPQFVPEENLSRVNGINGTIQSAVQFVSPVAAGALMAAGPFHNLLLIDVATAVVGIGLLAAIRIPRHLPTAKSEGDSLLSEMVQGIRFTWNHPFLRQLLATYGAYIFLNVPAGFLAVLMITRTFGDNVLYLTINETVGFAGMMAGGLLLGITGGFRNRIRTFVAGALLYGAASLAVGFTSAFWLFAALMFLIGMTIPAAQTAVFTLVQEKVEPAMAGRVFSLVQVMFTGFMPLGMMVFGPMADVVRIQVLVVACGVLVLALGLSMALSRCFQAKGEASNPIA